MVIKIAVTLLATFIVTTQGPVPVQAPDQPANFEAAADTAVRAKVVVADVVTVDDGVAVSVTTVPKPYIPPVVGPGLAVIKPSPTVVRVSTNCSWVKVAVALLAASIVTLHVGAVPEQAPDQPANW